MEYSGADLGDVRLNRRLQALGAKLAPNASQSLPKLFTTEAELAAAYRFLNHKKLTVDALMAPHVRATQERALLAREVLVLHDSTQLTFGGSTRQDLDSSNAGTTQHCLVHLSLCVTRTPRDILGLLRFSSHRDPVRPPGTPAGKKGKKARLLSRPKKERLSARWPEGIFDSEDLLAGMSPIHVTDSEGDDYELFARMKKEQVRFVIRANHDRLMHTDRPVLLSEVLLEVPAVAGRKVSLSRRRASTNPASNKKHPPRPARVARVEIGAVAVKMKRPHHTPSSQPKTIQLHMVVVRELQPPEGVEPIEWRLWTTEPIETAEQVLRVVDIYLRRWLIEEYIKALKSGCNVEKRELESRDALMRLVGLMAPVAWHMLRMREWERRAPTTPAGELLPPIMLEVLQKAAVRYPLPLEPTVQQALQSIAGMGGYLKRNGPPGFQTLAKGYRELLLMVEGYRLAQQEGPNPYPISTSEDVSNR